MPLEPFLGAVAAGILLVACSFLLRLAAGEDDDFLQDLRKCGYWIAAIGAVGFGIAWAVNQ